MPGRNWQKIKQKLSNKHPEVELLQTENYSLSSSTLSSKNKSRYSKKMYKK